MQKKPNKTLWFIRNSTILICPVLVVYFGFKEAFSHGVSILGMLIISIATIMAGGIPLGIILIVFLKELKKK
jgi:hypothetical protein